MQPPPAAGPRFLPVLLVLFAGSGCAALIYEIVWFQLLQLVIGSTAVSMAVLLGTSMGGMCIGSLALARVIGARRHPLAVYAALEAGIGLAGLLALVAVPAVSHLYLNLVGHGLPGIFLRAVVCILCLLPPTVLMGATLPAMARWVETTRRGVSWLGFFYGGNTFGAVIGCLVAGFYLLRVYDMKTATLCAVALNFAVAAGALAISRLAPARAAASLDAGDEVAEAEVEAATATASPEAAAAVVPPSSPTPVLIAIGLSGLCALGAEVVWTRVLALMLGATVYTFSIILGVFLIGLGVGSSAGAAIARDRRNPRFALGLCQILQVAAIAWASQIMIRSLPYWPVDPLIAASPLVRFQLDFVRCAWAILPATMLWGASFPLALAALATPGRDPAQLVGRAYAANTIGAIVGAVATSLWLVPAFGTQHAQAVFVGGAVIAAIVVLVPCRPTGVLGLGAVAALAAAVIAALPPLPWQLVAYGRQTASTNDQTSKLLFLGEGMNSTVAVSQTPAGDRFFHVSGKTEASSLPKDMKLQRMLGNIPAMLHPNPKSVLIVGCGAGVTAGSFAVYPTIQRIVICDIEPLIPQKIAPNFKKENYDIVHDPRVEIVYDDARHFIATTTEKFDIITSDPIHPWVKGSAVLYSHEYFDLCRQRLNPGGFVTQWVPFYESDRAVVQSEIATFFSVFPHGTIWGNDIDGYGYDTVVLGQEEPLKVDLDKLQARFDDPNYSGVRESLQPMGMDTSVKLLSPYAGRAADMKLWLAGAQINRDSNLRLQYLAGMELNSTGGSDSYAEMINYREFPSEMFVSKSDRQETLRAALLPRAKAETAK